MHLFLRFKIVSLSLFCSITGSVHVMGATPLDDKGPLYYSIVGAPKNALKDAVKAKDLSEVQRLLEYAPIRATINTCDEHGTTVLGYAIYNTKYEEQDYKIAQALLQANADPNKGMKGKLPLLIAMAQEIPPTATKRPLVELLLQHGASPDMEDESLPANPLMIGINSCNPYIVDLFVNKSNIFQRTLLGSNALQLAAHKAQNHLVHKEKYSQQEHEKLTTIIDSLIRAILKEKNKSIIDNPDIQGNTTLHNIILTGHHALAKALLDAGANPNYQNYKGESPIYFALRFDNGLTNEQRISILSLLLEYGADINVLTKNHENSLHAAILLFDPQIIQFLIGHKADVFNKDAINCTALDHAQAIVNTKNVEQYVKNFFPTLSLNEFQTRSNMVIQLLQTEMDKQMKQKTCTSGTTCADTTQKVDQKTDTTHASTQSENLRLQKDFENKVEEQFNRLLLGLGHYNSLTSTNDFIRKAFLFFLEQMACSLAQNICTKYSVKEFITRHGDARAIYSGAIQMEFTIKNWLMIIITTLTDKELSFATCPESDIINFYTDLITNKDNKEKEWLARIKSTPTNDIHQAIQEMRNEAPQFEPFEQFLKETYTLKLKMCPDEINQKKKKRKKKRNERKAAVQKQAQEQCSTPMPELSGEKEEVESQEDAAKEATLWAKVPQSIKNRKLNKIFAQWQSYVGFDPEKSSNASQALALVHRQHAQQNFALWQRQCTPILMRLAHDQHDKQLATKAQDLYRRHLLNSAFKAWLKNHKEAKREIVHATNSAPIQTPDHVVKSTESPQPTQIPFVTTHLILAVQSGQISTVQALLHDPMQRATINYYDSYGRSALIYAVLQGNEAIVRLLLKAGAYVDLVSPLEQLRPLHFALHTKQPFIPLLIAYKADVNKQPTDRYSPLTAAIVAGNAPNVQTLLDFEVEVNLTDSSSKTPITYALEYAQKFPDAHRIAILHMLKSENDSSDQNVGEDPQIAQEETQSQQTSSPPDQNNFNFETLVDQVKTSPLPAMPTTAIQAHSLLHGPDSLLSSPHESIDHNHTPTTQEDSQQQSNDIRLLERALQNAQTTLKVFDEYNARVEEENARAQKRVAMGTPRHTYKFAKDEVIRATRRLKEAHTDNGELKALTFLDVVRANDVELGKKIVASGKVDVNMRGRIGQTIAEIYDEGHVGITALHIAAVHGYEEFVQLLLAHGADYSLYTFEREGVRPVLISRNTDISNLLHTHQEKVDDEKALQKFIADLPGIEREDPVVYRRLMEYHERRATPELAAYVKAYKEKSRFSV